MSSFAISESVWWAAASACFSASPSRSNSAPDSEAASMTGSSPSLRVAMSPALKGFAASSGGSGGTCAASSSAGGVDRDGASGAGSSGNTGGGSPADASATSAASSSGKSKVPASARGSSTSALGETDSAKESDMLRMPSVFKLDIVSPVISADSFGRAKGAGTQPACSVWHLGESGGLSPMFCRRTASWCRCADAFAKC
mmetsp:Transcript_62923/g.117690  ORF Transcript_62923/g.117690 Transcript_62923/m.117690 type:complete len:200 (-) Transcript_62923:109-708(-)